jgi:4-alpha-glucanotransferase
VVSGLDDFADLRGLADDVGIQVGYHDVRGRWVEPEVEALLAVLRALGVDVEHPDDAAGAREALKVERARRRLPPVAVAWDGHHPDVDLATAGAARLELEDGRAFDWTAPAGRLLLPIHGALPFGMHRVMLDGDPVEVMHVVSAPWYGCRPDGSRFPGRCWGVFVPVPGLRSARGVGVGDLTDLRRAAAAAGERGATVVAILPVLAGYFDAPAEPSPYAPVSRRAWSDLVVDLDRAAALTGSSAARAVLDDPTIQTQMARLRASELLDHAGAAVIVRRVVGAITSEASGAVRAQVERHLAEHPHLRRYARFRAAVDRVGRDWRNPSDLDGDVDSRAVDYHAFVQWLAHSQLCETVAGLREHGQVLALDLPVGAHRHGFDVWDAPERYALGATAGAPPDDFFADGQTWGFPPLHPERSRLDGHAAFRDALAHHFSAASMLRIDHVMHLHRLFWVPDGFPASAGLYVRAPAEEMWAVACLEAHRHGALVVGENLGTVPPEVDEAMRSHGAFGMYVGMFHADGGGDLFADAPVDSVASWATHDLPTFAGWWSGQGEAGRDALAARIGGASAEAAYAAVVEHLARSPAQVVMLDAVDCWGETAPHNVPGTGPEQPNWRRRLARPVEEWGDDEAVASCFERAGRARPRQAG